MKSFRWNRRGILIESGAGIDGFTHASHPVVIEKGSGEFLLIFSMRNLRKISNLFAVNFAVRKGCVEVDGPPRVVLSPGPKGTFDSEGLLGCCAVWADKNCLLYYTGWNNLGDGAWLCDTGLAEVSPTTWDVSRKFAGPVMSRGVDNPLFAAGTSVHFENGLYRSWYNRGIEWIENPKGESVSKYGIFYAESEDGVRWNYSGNQSIPFLDELEHSFGRPCVKKVNSKFHMWFGCRGGRGDPNYRLGYAFSDDGFEWTRRDDLVGLVPTRVRSDFDADAMTYPYVFSHEDYLFMLYNGSGYGASGLGYAVAKL